VTIGKESCVAMGTAIVRLRGQRRQEDLADGVIRGEPTWSVAQDRLTLSRGATILVLKRS
jgi:hypothetical protein